MSRYVEVDAFIKEVVKIQDLRRLSTATIGEALDRTPTADVVEVVRCKDCKWWKSIFSWNGKEHKVCVRESTEPSRESDDYCSYGERKILPKL